MQPTKFGLILEHLQVIIAMTFRPPNHKSTKLPFYKHFVIINLIQSAEILRIQILIAKIKMKIKLIIWHLNVEPKKVQQ
jgi:hypothetical protein